MADERGQGFVLFGKKIALIGGRAINSHRHSTSMRVEEETEQDHLVEAHYEVKAVGMIGSSTNSKASARSSDEEIETAKPQKDESDQKPEQKTLKKPDKILPCPRCNSMDTKFCYYNNYNVNQPRHFCKSCQRYWTAGGTMRNVPVGAGRRKNKNSNSTSTSHCRYITISEALEAAAQFDTSDALHSATSKGKENVLTFGSDSIFEPMASAFKLTDQKASNGTQVNCSKGENGDDCSSGSSVTTSSSMAAPKVTNIQSFPSQVSCIPPAVPCIPPAVPCTPPAAPCTPPAVPCTPPAVPCIPPAVPYIPPGAWPYPWNTAVPFPALCPPGFTMPFYPSPYWNCGVPGAWGVPWPLHNQNAQGLQLYSAHSGKHPREEESQKPDNQEEEPKKLKNTVLIPKTLRIDDPKEAAKSSIWATLGIKNDSINRGELFKAFQAKGEEKNDKLTNSPALQANPAALSRSLCFQERAP